MSYMLKTWHFFLDNAWVKSSWHTVESLPENYETRTKDWNFKGVLLWYLWSFIKVLYSKTLYTRHAGKHFFCGAVSAWIAVMGIGKGWWETPSVGRTDFQLMLQAILFAVRVWSRTNFCRHCTHEQVPYHLARFSLLFSVCVSFVQLSLILLQDQHRKYMKWQLARSDSRWRKAILSTKRQMSL